MSDAIAGFCRFSFLGRGDWQAYSRTEFGSPEEAAAMERVAATLYDDARLDFRFRTFEALTLPSIAAQTDPDFVFVVLTSAAMPVHWRARLTQICAAVPQVRLIISDAPDVGSAIVPLLAELRGDGRLVQFRLDDDDCLSTSYISHLRRASHAMRDYFAFSFSLPKALIVTKYADEAARSLEMARPFHSAGVAVRPRHADQTVFSFGHLALARRFPALTDYGPHGSLQIKGEGHDSRKVVPGRDIIEITDEQFAKALRNNFAFVDPAQLESLTNSDAIGLSP